MELLHCYVYFLLCVCIWFEGFFFNFLKKKSIYLFIWLHQVLVTVRGILSCGMRPLSCGMWHLAP